MFTKITKFGEKTYINNINFDVPMSVHEREIIKIKQTYNIALINDLNNQANRLLKITTII